MPRRRPGSPGTASGPGFRRDPGHETAPGINGHSRAGKVPDPARISRKAWVGAAPQTLWTVNQALASGVGFQDIERKSGVDGRRVSVSVESGGRRLINKKN